MSAIVYATGSSTERKNWLARPIAGWITPATILLAAILLLSLGLHLYNIQSIGEANTYYTAAVKSMLQSWHNFFFAAAEPGGSVTVDKPPLGFWIETAFAAVLGVSGFSVSLPNIIAGVLSVWVLYHLINKYFGTGPALVAALALALTPVSVAVDRNNTIDGMLILTLLLAAWAFLNATETGRLRYLLLGALLVGLGFNIKMMQAFLPLPAFYGLYFLGAKTRWGRKFLNLALATVVLLVVSFSWAVIVDATPASQRPFVGSTQTNSEMELIFGYNGLSRLLGQFRGRGATSGLSGLLDRSGLGSSSSSSQGGPAVPPNAPPFNRNGSGFQPGNPPPFNGQNGSNGFFQRNGGNRAFAGGPGGGGGMFNTGQPGPLRFFQAPLAKEMSWLLPFGLLALILLAVSARPHLPLVSNEHKALILWGGWLVTCLVFFSIAGFFHNYYLATVAPALAAMVGGGYAVIEKLKDRSRLLAVVTVLFAAGITLYFQLYLISLFGLSGSWPLVALALLALAVALGLVFMLWKRSQAIVFRTAGVAALAAMLIIPGVWTAHTSISSDSNLPEAYSGSFTSRGFGFGRGPGGFGGTNANQALISYLEANTQNTRYLVAVPSSQNGSGLVLATGRPVLYMGGFSGQDPVVDVQSLSQLVASGQLRYVLEGGFGGFGRGGSSNVSSWVRSNCTPVNYLAQSIGRTGNMQSGFGETLYQCSVPPSSTF